MPVLPEYDAKEGLDAGRMPTPNFDTSAQQAAANQGAMIQKIGGQLTAEAARWQQIQQQKEQFNARVGIDKLVADQDREDQEAFLKAPQDGSGLSQERTDSFTKRTAEYVQSLPAHLRPDMGARLAVLEQKRATVYAATEQKLLGDFSIKQIGSDLEGSKVAVHNDPNSLDERLADMRDRVSVAPGIPDSQKPQVFAKIEQQLKLAAAGQLHKADPEATAKMLGITYEGTAGKSVKGNESTAMSFFVGRGWSKEQAAGLVGNLIHESRLNTGARNPGDGSDGSDSIGIAQWNAERARALKEFAASRGKPATDFRTQLEFVDHELRTTEGKAGERLRNAKTATEAAAAIVEAYERPKGSDRGAASAMGWAERRGHAERLSSGRVQVASLGGTATDAAPESAPDVKPDPRFASLTLEERQSVLKAVEIERATKDKLDIQMQTQAAAEAEAVRKREVDQLQFRAADGKLTMEELDSKRPMFKDFEEYNSVRSQMAKGDEGWNNYNGGVEKLQQPNAVWNPASKEDKDMLTAIDQKTGDLDRIKNGDQKGAEAVVSRFRDIGMVSPELKGTLQGMIRSGNQRQQEFAMSTMDQMYRTNPGAFDSAMGADAFKDLQNWQSSLNMDRGQYWEERRKANDPSQIKARQELETQARKAVTEKWSDKDILNVFDDEWFGFPGAPDTTKTFAGMGVLRAEFSDFYAEGFANTGDPEKAKEFASQRMKKVWARSDAAGGKMVKYAPEVLEENIFPSVGGKRDWLKTQVHDALRKVGAYSTPVNTLPGARNEQALAEYTMVPVVGGPNDTRSEIEALRAGKPLPGGRKSPMWVVGWKDQKTGEDRAAMFTYDLDAVIDERKTRLGGLEGTASGMGQLTNSGLSSGTALSPLTNARSALTSMSREADRQTVGENTAYQRDRADEIDGAEMRRDARSRRREDR